MQIIQSSVPLRKDPNGPLDNTLLFGELVSVVGETVITDNKKTRWIYATAILDGYDGFIPYEECGSITEVTQKISVPRTIAYKRPDLKSPPSHYLSFGVRVQATDQVGAFTALSRLGWVPTQHLMAVDDVHLSYVEVARQHLYVPYLWGARDAHQGVDCSGLVQQALLACGRIVPRDSKDQEREIGVEIKPESIHALRRGDFVFWKGHVGIVTENEHDTMLIHATAEKMMVVEELLSDVIERRIGAGKGEPTNYRRLP
jgi:cell wall-associated NlpC family hydrolase